MKIMQSKFMLNQATLFLSKWECVDHNELFTFFFDWTYKIQWNEWMNECNENIEIQTLNISKRKHLKAFGTENILIQNF